MLCVMFIVLVFLVKDCPWHQRTLNSIPCLLPTGYKDRLAMAMKIVFRP